MKKFLVIAGVLLCFVVSRPAAQAQEKGIDGKWHFVLETPGGDREVDADFTVNSEGLVTGKWGDADVAGTYKDGKVTLDFQFTSEEAGTTAAMKIDGKLDENSALTGDWAFSEYTGTFKATRPRAEPAAGTSDSKPNPQSGGR